MQQLHGAERAGASAGSCNIIYGSRRRINFLRARWKWGAVRRKRGENIARIPEHKVRRMPACLYVCSLGLVKYFLRMKFRSTQVPALNIRSSRPLLAFSIFY
jgi:hypothetical protein